jgi:hypothetical protein
LNGKVETGKSLVKKRGFCWTHGGFCANCDEYSALSEKINFFIRTTNCSKKSLHQGIGLYERTKEKTNEQTNKQLNSIRHVVKGILLLSQESSPQHPTSVWPLLVRAGLLLQFQYFLSWMSFSGVRASKQNIEAV